MADPSNMRPNHESHGHAVRTVAYSLISGLVGMLLTYSTAVTGQSERLATLSESVSNIKKEITEMKIDLREANSSRYRSNDAQRDFRAVTIQISQNAKQIDELQDLINRHIEVHRNAN